MVTRRESAERVISPYETDARASRKRETEWVGYKAHLTETCGEDDDVHLIVQAQITAATEQDVEETLPLLNDLQARDLVPEVRLVDSGYVSGEVRASHAELGIELVGPLRQEGGWQHETGYGLSAFQVDWQQQQVRCPQGHLSQNWCPGRHNRGEEVIQVSFSAVTCQACPVKELCTKREKSKGRILTLSPQRVHEARERRRAEQRTPPFQERYALRAGIEGWDSHPGLSVLCLLLHGCARCWQHDVRTKFPSRVIHTPICHKRFSILTEDKIITPQTHNVRE
jgi:transposase